MNIREVMQKNNIRFTKSLGQNFLADEAVVKRIADAAEIDSKDLLIEVGPGIGSMTGELALRAGRVVAVEIDKRLIPALIENLKGFTNIDIINTDIMKVNLKEVISGKASDFGNFKQGSVKVVANLPYYLTTPIVMKFLEENTGIDAMIFMVQKEVAERMVARPGGKDYGALSVAVQYYSLPERIFDVPAHKFIPRPDVDSTVIKLRVHKTPPVQLTNRDMFFKTVKAAFGQRRKTLVNALYNSGYFIEDKEEIKQILKNTGIGGNQRGETLSIMQFAMLANAFSIKNS